MNNPPEGGLRQPRLLLRQQFSSIHGGGRGVSDTRHAGEAVAWSSSFRDQCRGSPAVPITTSRPRVFGSAVETLSTNRRAPDLARRLDEKAQEADRSRSAEIREARRAHLRDKPKDG
jgi:hypothetical protein